MAVMEADWYSPFLATSSLGLPTYQALGEALGAPGLTVRMC